jgi:CubicO group peptidase (beta-lactamase class C family)
MTDLHDLLASHVTGGTLPGAVALVARGDDVEVAAVGSVDVEGTAPMARDSLFRLASTTKPITAAAAMMLVDDGRVGLDDPVALWLPELASPMVVRRPDGPVDEVVPANRPITLADLLSFTAGYGFPADFSLPAVQLILGLQNPYSPQDVSPPDEWMKALAAVPMLHQPGEAWLYNTCSDILGVLIARIAARPFADFLAERVFEPLGMVDTGFFVPRERLPRLAGFYHPGSDGGGLVAGGTPDEDWTIPPPFPSGGGGLVSTVDDWAAFGRMLLAGGTVDGRRILSAEAVRLMTTDRLTPAQRQASALFLEGQGWGFGGSVDVEPVDPWNVPGRYGWVGGSGTSAHVTPATGTVSVLLTQVSMTSPTPSAIMRDFWRYAAGV